MAKNAQRRAKAAGSSLTTAVLYSIILILGSSSLLGCALITTPVKVVGTAATTTIKTTGAVASAPFKAAGNDSEE